jgi:hypothetical protein
MSGFISRLSRQGPQRFSIAIIALRHTLGDHATGSSADSTAENTLRRIERMLGK